MDIQEVHELSKKPFNEMTYKDWEAIAAFHVSVLGEDGEWWRNFLGSVKSHCADTLENSVKNGWLSSLGF